MVVLYEVQEEALEGPLPGFDMKRYDVEANFDDFDIVESPDGEWVKYEDVEASADKLSLDYHVGFNDCEAVTNQLIKKLENRLGLAFTQLEELGCDNQWYLDQAQALLDRIEEEGQ